MIYTVIPFYSRHFGLLGHVLVALPVDLPAKNPVTPKRFIYTNWWSNTGVLEKQNVFKSKYVYIYGYIYIYSYVVICISIMWQSQHWTISVSNFGRIILQYSTSSQMQLSGYIRGPDFNSLPRAFRLGCLGWWGKTRSIWMWVKMEDRCGTTDVNV